MKKRLAESFFHKLMVPLTILSAMPGNAPGQTFREAVTVAAIRLQNPLDGEPHISGTFGEPRPNHYHSGLDIKTGGSIGWPVKAVDDGHLSRVKISAGGYGKALYVTHPSGLTSVYAHLEEFKEPLAAMVRKWQYERESFELDTLLPKDLVQFKRGEVIALSGNTGSSAGPHLHFEVRETLTEWALNPMRFLEKIKDTQSPVTGKLKVYPFQNSFYEAQPLTLQPVMKNGIPTADVMVPEGKFCISAEAFDKQDLTPEHKNGIPILRMSENGQTPFIRRTDTIDFSLTRYAHALVDYGARLKTGSDFYLFCRLPGNLEGKPYQSSPGNGMLTIKSGESRSLRLELEDFHGNVSAIQLNVTGKAPAPFAGKLLDSTGKVRSLQLEGATLTWSSDSWYDNPVQDISVKKPGSLDAYSNIYQMFTITLPAIHSPLTLELIQHTLPAHLLDKALMVLENIKGSKKALKTAYKDGVISATFNEPGQVWLTIDTTPPKISMLNFNQGTKAFSGNQIRCKISDDLSGIQTYRGTIDGQWILMEYDAKSATLSYSFDEKCPKGEHQFQLVVTDGKSNESTFSTTFKNQ